MTNNITSFLIKIIKKASNMVNDNYKVEPKGENSDLVTNIDYEIETYLIEEIRKNYPGFDIVSEEYNSSKIITQNCFTIDPLDGTINFANKLPLWGIQIACIKDGKTVAAVIYLPKLKELYYADETGSYMNNKKIRINTVPIKNTLYSIDGTNNLPIMQKVRQYSSGRRNFGAVCISMAFVAAGRIHAAVFRSDKPWDYTPGLFISKMAGASIIDVNGFHGCAMNDEFLNILKSANDSDM